MLDSSRESLQLSQSQSCSPPACHRIFAWFDRTIPRCRLDCAFLSSTSLADIFASFRSLLSKIPAADNAENCRLTSNLLPSHARENNEKTCSALMNLSVV